MTRTRYPRIEELGLDVIQIKWPMTAYDWSHAVDADKLEALLESAPVVYGVPNEVFSHVQGDRLIPGTERDGAYFKRDTHSARLIGITPLVKESEERQLLREIVALGELMLFGEPHPLIQRARRLLEREG